MWFFIFFKVESLKVVPWRRWWPIMKFFFMELVSTASCAEEASGGLAGSLESGDGEGGIGHLV